MLLQEDKKELEKQAEFDFIIQDLVSNETVQKMKLYKQHYDTSCFEHCKNVAYYSYLLCKKYHLDYVSVARAGMLHMWPVTFFHFPKYKESYIITLVDKYCAIQESINAYRSKSSIQKLYRYAYVFLSMLIILR